MSQSQRPSASTYSPHLPVLQHRNTAAISSNSSSSSHRSAGSLHSGGKLASPPLYFEHSPLPPAAHLYHPNYHTCTTAAVGATTTTKTTTAPLRGISTGSSSSHPPTMTQTSFGGQSRPARTTSMPPHHHAPSHADLLEQSFGSRASSFFVRRLSSRFDDSPQHHHHNIGEFRQGTVAGITINTLCNVMGAGVLSLPLAMHNASIGLGVLLVLLCCIGGAFSTLFLAYGCQWTGKGSYAEVVGYAIFPLKKSNQEEDDRRHIVDETTTPRHLRNKKQQQQQVQRRRRRWLQLAIESIIFLNNFGCLIIYARVIADSTPHVVRYFFQNGESSMWTEPATWYIVSSILFFGLSCAKSMEELKWTSLLGVVTIMYIVVVVVIRYFTMHAEREARHEPQPSVRLLEVQGLGAIRAMASLSAAFLYHPNVPYFYTELRNATPSAMMNTVLFSFPVIFLSYLTTGVLGYLAFGDAVADSAAGGDVVNNFPTDDTVVNIGRFGLFFHFACVFPVISICARRALHRLLMAALRGVIAPTAPRAPPAEEEMEFGAVVADRADASESSLLLPNAVGAPSGETTTAAALRLQKGSDRGVVYDESELASSAAAVTAGRPTFDDGADDMLDGDDDDDGPENTSRFAIVAEAALLVSFAVFLAAVAPGISFVLEIIGAVFGTTLMLVLPGLTGVFLFRSTTMQGPQEDDSGEGGDRSPRGRGPPPPPQGAAYQYFAATDRNDTVLTSGLSVGRRRALHHIAVGITAIGLFFLLAGCVSLCWR